jgi:hypothetical protein
VLLSNFWYSLHEEKRNIRIEKTKKYFFITSKYIAKVIILLRIKKYFDQLAGMINSFGYYFEK